MKFVFDPGRDRPPALIVPGGVIDGDNEVVALGLVLAILGPISLRIMSEAGAILGRVDERFEVW